MPALIGGFGKIKVSIKKRYYSINNVNSKLELESKLRSKLGPYSSGLNPFYVTGFSDAEACFIIDVSNKRGKNWSAAARFQIKLHSVDMPLINKIQIYFGGVGSITVDKNNVVFRVSKINDIINIIIPHFDKYSLQSAKSIDYKLWKACAILIKNKDHLTEKGLNELISLKSALNKGLSEDLKVNFPFVIGQERPIFIPSNLPLNPYWVSGFIDGDGSFNVYVHPESGYVNLRLIIGLNNREDLILRKIYEFFGQVGRIHWNDKQQAVYYTIGNIKDLSSKIITHFDIYLLVGNKLDNYLIWKDIDFMVESKTHLTKEGLNLIKELKLKLNKYPNNKINDFDKLNIKNMEDLDSNSTNKMVLNSSSPKNKNEILKASLPKGFREYSTSTKTTDSLINLEFKKGPNGPSHFSSYLAGLIEADGCIAVHNKDSNAKLYRPKFIVVFNKADEPLAKKLASITESGTVYKKDNAGYVIWQIQKTEDVVKIINIINGYMRTPKIEALHRAIIWFNTYCGHNIKCLDLDQSDIDSNGWLAGFTDGDGNFSILLVDRKKKGIVTTKRVQAFFRIEFKQTYQRDVSAQQGGNSYFTILNKIATYLNVNLYTRTREKEDKVFYAFMVISHNAASHIKVINYFDRFPLYSSKYLAYKDWSFVVNQIRLREGKPLSREDILAVEKIKAQFNNKRKIIDFSHLDSLTV